MADKKVIDGFIAVRMPAGVRKRLESVSKALRDAGVGGEWQEEGTHHLTLKYIGEIESEKYDAIAEALREPCGALSLPTFTVGPLFTFDAHDSRAVLAARVTPKADLERLVRVLERVAVENGAEKSKFPTFKPHVTLCYLNDKEEWRRAKSEIDLPDEFGEMTISTVPLNESKGEGDFKIRRTVRVGRSRAFHDVWAALTPATSFPSADATEVTCPHCEWNPVSKGEDGSFRCPTCTMRFWPSGKGPSKKRKAPKEGIHECAKCGQGIMAHGEASEAENGKVYCADCYDGNFAWCDSCEKEVRKGAEGTTEFDGDWFCKDCPPTACEECSEKVHPDKVQECDGATFCEECYDENCVTCADCSETMLKENAIDAFDTWFCEDHRPYSCESCGDYITEDGVFYGGGDTYCELCWSDVREQMTKDQWHDFYASHPKLEEIGALQSAADEDEMEPDIYVKIFADMDWDSSYGGDAWAHIAETWRDLARSKESKDWTRTLVLTDHAFDLAHNNGSLFTKAIPEVRKWLLKALEEKYFRDPLEYRHKLSTDARRLLDAHIRYNAGGVAKWKEHMDGKAGAMSKMEKAIVNQDNRMAKRLWEAFDLSVQMFRGRDSFLEVAFWSAGWYGGGRQVVEDIREFMRAGDPERLVKIMTSLPPDTCKPGSTHPAAPYLWDRFMPRAVEIIDGTPNMRERMRKVPTHHKDRMKDWEKFIESAKRRHKEESKEDVLVTALAAAFLKVALNRTDFYDFYALTVVDCDGLPDDMVRLCRGLKRMTLIQVSGAIMTILKRAVVREARHVEYHVGTES